MTRNVRWYWHFTKDTCGFSVGFKVRNWWHDPLDPHVTVWIMLGPGWLMFDIVRDAS